MIRLLLCSLSLVWIAACGDPDQETKAEYDARARAADQEAADGTIARIPDGTETTVDPRPSGGLANHPLSRFFNAHGREPLKYIGKFWNKCDPEHTAYVERICDEAIERGIRVGKSIGIELTRADLVNREYWEFYSTINQLRIKHRQDYFDSLGRPPKPTDTDTYNREFRETVTKMMADMDDR